MGPVTVISVCVTKYSTLQAGESLKGVSLFFARLCLRVGLLGFLRKAIRLFSLSLSVSHLPQVPTFLSLFYYAFYCTLLRFSSGKIELYTLLGFFCGKTESCTLGFSRRKI